VAPLFTFGSPATSGYATVGQEPSRYYAVDGDIVGLRAGSEVLLGYPAGAAGVRYEASTPVAAIRAGRDITDSGTQLGRKDTVTGRLTSTADTRGNLIAHAFADDVSVVPGAISDTAASMSQGPACWTSVPVAISTWLTKASSRAWARLWAGRRVTAPAGPVSPWRRVWEPEPNGMRSRHDIWIQPSWPTRPAFADQPGTALYDYSGALTLGQRLARSSATTLPRTVCRKPTWPRNRPRSTWHTSRR
jgi:hypothetical protein